jgi:adenylosuccinate synthase
MILVALSGPIASGKSAVADLIIQKCGGRSLRTSAIIKLRGAKNERMDLTQGGNDLDASTDHGWVLEGVLEDIVSKGEPKVLVIDAVRKRRQIERLREHFGSSVKHLHVTAPDPILEDRYRARGRDTDKDVPYESAKATSTEQEVRGLIEIADVVIDNERMDGKAAAILAAARLGVIKDDRNPLVDVIVGAQYGSEGKGNVCAAISNTYGVLMRVGGPNAGHKVPSPKHTFVHLPSGSLSNRDAQVIIGAGATIDVATLLKEFLDLKAYGYDLRRVKIDPQAMIIEESDKRYEELSMDAIGSTKKGVGAATARKILGRDGKGHLLLPAAPVRLAKEIPQLFEFIEDTKEILERAYARGERILLEGTQGTTLSIHHGPYPHVTSRETTVSGCLADAGIAPSRVRKVIMVTRTYPIRVGGTSGDIMNEISPEIISERSGVPVEKIKDTELGSISNKPRRIGEFDWDQLKKSSVLNAPTDIALTFADYLDSKNSAAKCFDDLTSETKSFIATVEAVADAPVSLISVRFADDGVIDRRSW